MENIYCFVLLSDKAGNEISAKKIVNVDYEGCLSIETDSLVYKALGEYNIANYKLHV